MIPVIIATFKRKDDALTAAEDGDWWVVDSGGIYFLFDEKPHIGSWERFIYEPQGQHDIIKGDDNDRINDELS